MTVVAENMVIVAVKMVVVVRVVTVFLIVLSASQLRTVQNKQN